MLLTIEETIACCYLVCKKGVLNAEMNYNIHSFIHSDVDSNKYKHVLIIFIWVLGLFFMEVFATMIRSECLAFLAELDIDGVSTLAYNLKCV